MSSQMNCIELRYGSTKGIESNTQSAQCDIVDYAFDDHATAHNKPTATKRKPG